jgi:hypothetical protein
LTFTLTSTATKQGRGAAVIASSACSRANPATWIQPAGLARLVLGLERLQALLGLRTRRQHERGPRLHHRIRDRD